MKHSKEESSGFETICLLALMMSLVALSIDIVLPALPVIAKDLSVVVKNDIQLMLSCLFVGLSVGQIFYGPLSDSIGRKGAIYVGILSLMLGSAISYYSYDYTWMLVGRVLQGFGAAGPRVVTIALVRDQFEGRAMAKVMSMVMAVFIFVPAVAPAMGQGILHIGEWHDLFLSLFLLSGVGLLWFALRQRETLLRERRRKFSVGKIASACAEVLSNKRSLGYIVCSGCISGGFVGYLSVTQSIFQDIYKKGEMFSIYFGVLALAIGFASFINSRLVMKFGMEALCKIAARSLFVLSALVLLYSLSIAGHPEFVLLLGFMLLSFFCIGILFGNLSTLAIQPMGHIAGTASAVIGSLQTLISVAIGYGIGRYYNETVIPLFTGFTVLSLVACLLLMLLKAQDIEAS